MPAHSEDWTHGEVLALAASLTDLPPDQVTGYVVLAYRAGHGPAIAHNADDPVSLINLLLNAVGRVAQAEISDTPYIE